MEATQSSVLITGIAVGLVTGFGVVCGYLLGKHDGRQAAMAYYRRIREECRS